MPALLRATTPNPCEYCKYAINKRPDKNDTMCATCYSRTDYVKTVGHDIGEKYCPRCGENKDENEFGPDKTKRDGKASTCRSCKRRSPKTPAPTQMIPSPPQKKNRGNSIYEPLPSELEKLPEIPEAGLKVKSGIIHKMEKELFVPNNSVFGGFKMTDEEANKIKAVLLHLHTVFNLGG